MISQCDVHKIVFIFTNKVIPKELLAQNVAWCAKHLKKLDKWSTREEAAGLKTVYNRRTAAESHALKK